MDREPRPTDDDARLRDLVRLNLVPGVGPKTFRSLLEAFGSADRILNAPEATLREVPGVGAKLAGKIAGARREVDADAELDFCRRAGVTPLAFGSAAYPTQLAEIPDPPALLYVKGTIEPVDRLAVAIVGSRKCTPYGLRIAERLATSLVRVGLTVVSGLARGIDAAAHRGALAGGGRTLAVLANGLGQVYPPEHDRLADEVAAAGALVAESPMRQEPLAGIFPQRNRIIRFPEIIFAFLSRAGQDEVLDPASGVVLCMSMIICPSMSYNASPRPSPRNASGSVIRPSSSPSRATPRPTSPRLSAAANAPSRSG